MIDKKKNRNFNPLVSVIVPIYNVEEYLKECVDSILNQTYRNLDVILVDDESPDECGKICDEYKSIDERVSVIHKKNGGLSDARNAGMKIAKGDYVTFVDSDDYISKNFIKNLVKAIYKYNADIAISNMERTSKRGENNEGKINNIKEFNSEEALVAMLYGNPFGTSAWGKLFKIKFFDNIEYPYGKFSEDLFTIYKTILQINKVVYVDFCGYYYYYREGSIAVCNYKEKHLEAIEAIDNIVKEVGNIPQYSNAIANQYINVIYDIAARNPRLEQFKNQMIQMPLKKYRFSVMLDSKASKRLRAFSALSFLGNKILLRTIVKRNVKWKV